MRIAVLLIAGLVSMVLALSRGPDEVNHETILRTVRSIELSDSALQRDVLQARAGSLRNYDFLDAHVVRMQADLAALNDALSLSVLDDQGKLDRLLSALSESIDREDTLVEEFKTRNALLQNSLRIFMQTFGDVRARLQRLNLRPSPDIERLGEAMWAFQSAADPNLAVELTQLLRTLDMSSPDVAELRRPLVDHGSLIIATLPEVDGVVSHMQASDIVAAGQAFQREYLRRFDMLNARESRDRLLLSSISLALCIYAAFLVIRQRLYADKVRWRLEVEQSVHDAVSRVSLESELFETSLEEAIERVQHAFDFRYACLARFDRATWTAIDAYGPRTTEAEAMVQDFLHEVRTREGPPSDLTLWRHPPRSLLQRVIPLQQQPDGPPRVASVIVQQDQQVIMLAAEYRQVRGTAVADRQILRMTTELLARTIEKRSRLAELDELKRRLEEAQRLDALGTFADGIAHEFNNLLTAIMGYAEMAVNAIDPHSPPHSYVEAIIGAGTRARLVVDQIHAVGRARQSLAKPFELIDAIVEIVPVLYLSVTQGVELRIEIPDPPIVMAGAPIEIQQILINLCKNAGEALQGNGEVVLLVETIDLPTTRGLSHGELRPGNYVRIAVMDNGPGIAAEHLSRIFEPFFTTKTHRGGTGLGLSVVQGIVKSLNGVLELRSAPGEGTTFELFFPLVEEEVNLEPTFELADVPVGNGAFVAIVDPVASSRVNWEEKVAFMGYEPVACETTQALVDWSRRTGWQPQLVLVDSHGDGDVDEIDVGSLGEAYWIHLSQEGELPSSNAASTRPRLTLTKPVDIRDMATLLAGLLGPASAPQVTMNDFAPIAPKLVPAMMSASQ